MVEDVVRAATLAYLREHQVMTLATQGPQGLWAAAVFYANAEFDLFFLSAGHTRHAQNIAASPHVAATIQKDYKDWPAIKGVQLEGRVEVLADAARKKAVALYQQKYPFLLDAAPEVRQALLRVNWYRLRPQLLYFIDNSKGFGHREAVVLAGGE